MLLLMGTTRSMAEDSREEAEVLEVSVLLVSWLLSVSVTEVLELVTVLLLMGTTRSVAEDSREEAEVLEVSVLLLSWLLSVSMAKFLKLVTMLLLVVSSTTKEISKAHFLEVSVLLLSWLLSVPVAEVGKINFLFKMKKITNSVINDTTKCVVKAVEEMHLQNQKVLIINYFSQIS